LALTAYLQEKSASILAALVEGTPIPPPERRLAGDRYLVNAFVEHVYRTDPEGFEFLEAVVKGTMLANTLVFPEIGNVARRFGRVAAYLDTPFLLRALGCEGPERETACLEVVSLLFEQGVDLAVFEHTVDEVLGVLNAAAHTLRAGPLAPMAHGPVIEYALQARRTASDIELLIANLRSRLTARHIHIVPRPPMSTKLSVDEQQLEDLLRQEVSYWSEDALRHDLECLTAIHRLRGGRFPRDLEWCEAVFVTTNEALARVGTRALTRAKKDGVYVPLCVLDTVFATLAWLKKPAAKPELPRKMIVAKCYAALQPPDNLWKAYLEEIHRLEERGEISHEEYVQLRLSTVAKNELMTRTLGGVDPLTSSTVKEALRTSREAILAEHQPEIERVSTPIEFSSFRRLKIPHSCCSVLPT
jgi:hypothetical protein